MPTSLCYRFGPFTLDLPSGQLRRGAQVLALQPKAFELLHYLLQHPNELLSREQLLEHVWAGVFVSDQALTQMIRKLRVVLEPDPSTPRYLETQRGRGYRFVAPVLTSHVAQTHEDFVGRVDTLEALTAALSARGNVVCLLAPGGAGKTRTVNQWRQQAPIPTVFVDLTQTYGRDGLHAAMAAALEVQLQPGGADQAAAQIGQVLRALGRSVLVLDNYEQLVPDANPDLASWINTSEHSWLLTSRVRPALPNEHILLLAPLEPLEARALFRWHRERAGVSIPLDDPAVEALVSDLDGNPLAIELAAARCRLMPVGELHRWMQKDLRVLGDASATGRHRGLLSALHSSWELLSSSERSVLAQCAAYGGSFDLPMAEKVVVLDGDAPWFVHLLQRLVDRSLLRLTDDGRLDFPISVREYAWARVTEPEATASRAALVMTTRIEARRAAHHLDPSPATLSELRIDLIPGQAVCQRCDELGLSGGTLAAHVALACAELGAYGLGRQLAETWMERADIHPSDLVNLTLAVLQGLDPSDPAFHDYCARARACAEAASARGDAAQATQLWIAQTRLTSRAGEPRRDLAALAVETSRTSGDASLVAEGLCCQAFVIYQEGRTEEAWRLSEEAMAVLATDADAFARGTVASLAGWLRSAVGDDVGAQEALNQAIRLRSALGTPSAVVDRTHLGAIHQQAGRFHEAIRAHRQAVADAKRMGLGVVEVVAQVNLGLALTCALQHEAALDVLEHALRGASASGLRGVECLARMNLAACHLGRGDLRQGGHNARRSLELSRTTGLRVHQGPSMLWLGISCMGDADAAQAHLDGLRQELEACASSSCELSVPALEAIAHFSAGRQEEARAVLAAMDRTAPLAALSCRVVEGLIQEPRTG